MIQPHCSMSNILIAINCLINIWSSKWHLKGREYPSSHSERKSRSSFFKLRLENKFWEGLVCKFYWSGLSPLISYYTLYYGLYVRVNSDCSHSWKFSFFNIRVAVSMRRRSIRHLIKNDKGRLPYANNRLDGGARYEDQRDMIFKQNSYFVLARARLVLIIRQNQYTIHTIAMHFGDCQSRKARAWACHPF